MKMMMMKKKEKKEKKKMMMKMTSRSRIRQKPRAPRQELERMAMK